EQFTNLSYEEMMERLEKIIARMDDGNIPLEESLRAFDEGMLLIQVAREKLESYRTRIEETVQEGQ
ncbi:MAG: exodeoxyribonuclease VII small subunit, partial [Clostridia bacterium]|nr:exodeoxyribonuclease VII small subunit [Clostridia bacterium]